MKARWAAVVVALAAFACAFSEAATFRVVPDQTRVGFAVPPPGIGLEQGHFDLTWGKIVLDPERHAGSIDFVVDAGSINTGWDLRDAFLKSEWMFDVQRYPSIRFHSTRLAFEGARLVGVDGDITLHGVTRPIRFDVTHIECGADSVNGRDGCVALVTGRISRSAFGMSFAIPLVGDEIALDFAITAIRVLDDREAETPRAQ